MGGAADAALCLAAAVSCCLLAVPSVGFVAGRQAAPSSPEAAQRFLGQRAPEVPEAAGSRGSALAVAGGLGLLAVGLAGARRRAAARAPQRCLPFGQLTAPKEFAGGLAGSEYHGWPYEEWDPLELSSRYPEHLPWYREAELKHGRVAMLAFVGLIVPDAVRIPLSDFEGDIDFVTAHNKLIYGVGFGPMWWLLIFCGVVESLRFKQLGLAFEKLTLENAGDLEFGKAFLPKTAEGATQLKVKELKNGRLAMLAVSGALTQGVLWDVHHFPFAP